MKQPARFQALLKNPGFTLVELLIVISIIAILSAIGVTAYKGINQSVRNTAKKADMDAIAKAYEVNYSAATNSYRALADSDFASGRPALMDSGAFSCISGPGCGDGEMNKFVICANLASDSVSCSAPSDTCYCRTSAQGEPVVTTGSECAPYIDLNTGLIAHWRLDDNPADTAADSTGSYPGIYENSAITIGRDPFDDNNPRVGLFPFPDAGNRNRIRVPDPADNGLDLGSGSKTWTMWIQPEQTSNFATLIDKITWVQAPTPTPGYYTVNYKFDINTAAQQNYIRIRIGDGTGGDTNNQLFYTPTNLYNTGWHFIAIVLDRQAGELKVFFDDGQLGTTLNVSGLSANVDTTRNFGIGDFLDASGATYKGQIDDVRVYNTALSSTQIAALYNAGYGCFP